MGASADEVPRRMHPFALLAEVLGVARGWAFPALIGAISMGGGHMGRVLIWGVMLIAVPALLFGMAEYFAFRYCLSGGELILDSGVLGRRRRVIPLSRVQNVEIRQNPLQRAFGVSELRVDTAAGDTEKAVPLVLAHADAERLRIQILGHRGMEAPGTGPEAVPPREVLAQLSSRDLVLAGATANEAGVIAAVLVGVLELAYRLPLGLPRLDRALGGLVPELPLLGAVLLGAGLLLIFFGLAWILSVTGALVNYWGFVLERSGTELHKAYGGFDRRDVTIPLARVQALRIEESLLRRPLGLASLKIETAGAGLGEMPKGGAEAFLPLAHVREIPQLAAAVFDDLAYGEIRYRPVHPYALRRAFLRYAALVLASAAGAAALLGTSGLWLLVLLIPVYLAAHGHYRHLGYALPPGFIVARHGFWNRVTWIVPDHKTQTLHLLETLFQRRAGVATLVIDTAAGQVPIMHLGRSEAQSVLAEVADRGAPTRQVRERMA